ncbi:MAG: hypothetical protein JW728_01215 [Candidatus Aureabacteria bacterium]|nr:hypothetical protein [Candidatus Auribacterota bacterium]
MKIHKWQVKLGVLLVILTVALYVIHYLIFRDAHHIFIYLLGDIAFIPVEVLIVTIIIHEVLTSREKKERMNKLNMVIGVFFNEVGRGLLKFFSGFDKEIKNVSARLIVRDSWTAGDYAKAAGFFRKRNVPVEMDGEKLQDMKEFLKSNREFLLRLLENPNLLEHESFTNLLWAVFHLADELAHRKNLSHLSIKDYEHISNDIKRAYSVLVCEWLFYMRHLQKNYPYLFSLQVRTNPLDAEAAVEFR